MSAYLGLLALTIAAVAASPTIGLDGPQDVDSLQGHVDYLLDPDWVLTIDSVTSPATSARFEAVPGRSADFGYTKSAIWLRFALDNTSASTRSWRLLFRENFLQLFEVYQLRDDGSVATLIAQDGHSAFASRPLGYPELAAPLELPPGASSTIFVRYWSGGSSELSFSIESEASFDLVTTRKTAKNFIYYGMMLILVIIAMLAFAVARRPIFLAYAGYSGCALLFIMHADGNAFKFLWPEAPLFNGYASIALGSGIILFGSIYSMLFLQTNRYHPVLDKLLAGTIALTIGMLVSSIFVDHQMLKKALVLLAFLAILLFVVSGLVAAWRRFKRVRFYVIAWTGAVVSSAIMTGRHWLGIEISEEVQFDSMRIVMVSDAALMGLAIWDHFNQLRQARQLALQSSLEQTRRNLRLSQRLQDLEQQYATARKLAETQEQKIMDIIHDLNQPLHALRLSVRSFLAGGAGAEGSTRIEETFTYLEQLVAGHLERSVLDVDGKAEQDEVAGAADTLGVREVLDSIHEMFLPDARAKGLKFRLVKTRADVGCEPLVLMRIVSNLVANAIKYTEQGGVLLGCRRAGDVLRIEVHDSGPGMSAEEFGHVKNRAVRLDRDLGSKEGTGLGLSIAHVLAQSRGYSLTLCDKRKRGAGIILTMAALRNHAGANDHAANGSAPAA